MTDTAYRIERQQADGGEVVFFSVIGVKNLNLVGQHTMTQCAAALGELAEDANVRLVVLRGASSNSFIGGADLRELGSLDAANAAAFIRGIHGFCQAIRQFPVPVVAEIHGYCLGAGLEIAAACDFRLCDDSAMFGMPEVRVGVPSVVEAALLVQLVGWGKARELVYRGNLVDAKEAARIGLVEHHLRAADLETAIASVIADICAGAPNAIRLQKSLVRQWEQLPMEQAIEAGVSSFVKAYESDEPDRYTRAFFENKA